MIKKTTFQERSRWGEFMAAFHDQWSDLGLRLLAERDALAAKVDRLREDMGIVCEECEQCAECARRIDALEEERSARAESKTPQVKPSGI